MRYRLRTLLIVLAVIAVLVAIGAIEWHDEGVGAAIKGLHQLAPEVEKRNQEVRETPATLLKPLSQWSSEELEKLKRETEHRPGPKGDPPTLPNYSPFPNGYPPDSGGDETMPLAAPPLPQPTAPRNL
jgi:hypothetical protein